MSLKPTQSELEAEKMYALILNKVPQEPKTEVVVDEEEDERFRGIPY